MEPKWDSDPINQSDLLSRTLGMQLLRLSEEQRRPEQEIKDAFNRLHPQFLGLICDAVSIVLANLDGVVVEKAPRMADFTRLAMAAAPAFGATSEQFLEAYRDNLRDLERDAIESSVVGILVEKLMTTKPHFKGTASKLLPILRKLAGDRQYDRTLSQKRERALWPASADCRAITIRRQRDRLLP